MKNFAQISRLRGGVGVGWHHIAHIPPPLLAFGGSGDGLPPSLILDLNVTKELPSFGVKKNRVVVYPVLLEERFQIRPDRIVAMFVLLFFSSVNGHYESLADHFHGFVSMPSRG